jgi:hypothetical protein
MNFNTTTIDNSNQGLFVKRQISYGKTFSTIEQGEEQSPITIKK